MPCSSRDRLATVGYLPPQVVFTGYSGRTVNKINFQNFFEDRRPTDPPRVPVTDHRAGTRTGAQGRSRFGAFRIPGSRSRLVIRPA
jgi:hypothetical protein